MIGPSAGRGVDGVAGASVVSDGTDVVGDGPLAQAAPRSARMAMFENFSSTVSRFFLGWIDRRVYHWLRMLAALGSLS